MVESADQAECRLRRACRVIYLFTVAVLGVDVMTGSELQLETPYGYQR